MPAKDVTFDRRVEEKYCFRRWIRIAVQAFVRQGGALCFGVGSNL
ncbi:hypothetical protein GCM10007416_30330 [Kroppenstedtia guangzhouensis]|uniref:Uncharacterized protein n=1 Tax=Kroppenstedtia guangzhouensis TaxID=1274356 RepID=A0ABQ1H0X3_9BACL|nr:hypothetical protein GCM10007416_30330 [Kroppenstedtia guangzhouensis]